MYSYKYVTLLRWLLCSACLCLPIVVQADWVYVTNEKDDTVSVIDSDSYEVIKTIDVGLRPRGVTLSKDFKRLYICASDSDAVQVFDIATDTVLHDLPSGEDPEQFALHPDDRHLYIANEDDAIATVVDTQTRKVVAQIDVGVEPEGMAVSHNGQWAIVTSETTNMAHWIDTDKQELVDNTLVDQRPRDAEFTLDDSELWVSSEIGGTVSVIDVASRQIKHVIKFAINGISEERIQPVGMELTRDGKYAFIALGPANHIAVVDRSTYETNGVSGDVTVVDARALKPIKTIKVGRFPWGATVLPKEYLPQ